MKPGTYRLTVDLPALKPDRRKRHDWRAAPVRAGTLIVVEDRSWEVNHLPQWDGKAWFVAYPSGEYSHYSVNLSDLPEGTLEAVDETPSLWLAREHSGLHFTREILDRLVANGLVTLDQIKEVADAVLNEDP